MIDVAVFDEHKLVSEGLAGLLSGISDIRVLFVCNDRGVLTEKIKFLQVHVLILSLPDISVRNFNLIVQLNIGNPKVKILVSSMNDNEDIVLKTIKAGAKGFLGPDSDRNDIIEAIFTLRNGHDFLSKSITHLLLNRYISTLKQDKMLLDPKIASLSSREIEILKLWGDSHSNHEIADRFFISVRTVESHKNHIMQKLNLKSTVDMVKFAIKNNIIEI
jgi:DNA-binding NarL/FixJ family response regulator